MKIRTGFVSNSSSSSFIFWFNNIPESKEEVRILLYGENPPRFTTHWDDDAISTEQVASIVFDDIKNSDVFGVDELITLVKEEIKNFSQYSISDGHVFIRDTEYIDEYNKLAKKIMGEEEHHDKIQQEYFSRKQKGETFSTSDEWNRHYEKLDELSIPMFDLIEKALKDKYSTEKFITTGYSDEDGMLMSYIEHSGVLDNITIQSFSHH